MKTIQVKNLVIQFDSASKGEESVKDLTQSAIDQINEVLQRELSGLGAQILSSGLDDSDIEVLGYDDVEDEEE
jgi:hypothetical protein